MRAGDVPFDLSARIGAMVQPFSNGTQQQAWRRRNCHECAKFNPDVYDGGCDIDLAIGVGRMPESVARRMGYAFETPGQYSWDCPEREYRA